MEPNLKAIKAIADLPLNVGPFVQSTTGALVPFYTDSRCLYSHPKSFKVFVDEMTKIIRHRQARGQKIDLIVGVPMAGIPLAMALSLKTGIPFAYLNKERKKTLSRQILEGYYKKGARALLVDDVIALGGTIWKAIKDCRSEGVIVKHIMTLWNPWWPKNKPFLLKLRRHGFIYDTLYTRLDWLDYIYKDKIISQDAFTVQKAYLLNPTDWHKNKIMWRKFLQIKKHYQKTGKL